MELGREAVQPDRVMDVVMAKEELQEPVLAVKLAGSKEIASTQGGLYMMIKNLTEAYLYAISVFEEIQGQNFGFITESGYCNNNIWELSFQIVPMLGNMIKYTMGLDCNGRITYIINTK